MIIHMVAHARAAQRPLADADACWAMWWRLRRAFPDVLAVCLMPDHLHLLLHALAEEAARRLGCQLGGFSRERRAGAVWQPVPPPRAILGDDKVERQIRYIHLNPDRAGFVADPMSWLWSTHRDVIGARVDPWVSADELSASLGRPGADFVDWFHGYVSADPSVAVGGTPPPAPATSGSLQQIADAARFAAPGPAHVAARRHLFVLVAKELGHSRASIAAFLGVAGGSVTRLAGRPAPELLRAGLLCLGDPRLQQLPRFRRPRAA